MTQLFDEAGNVMPATIVKVGPCTVTQIKTVEEDGYAAVQVGFGKKKNLSKALKGHFKNFGDFRFVKEFRSQKDGNQIKFEGLNVGNVITAETFAAGDIVKISGTSKGKGFQGVVRRHHFHGHPATHGHKDQERMPGSIGAGGVQHVVKGRRMAGHMGDEQTTIKNLEIVKVDLEKGLIYLKGTVPGARHGLVEIIGKGELKIQEKQEKVAEPVKEEKVETPVEETKEEVKVEEVAVPAEAPAETPAETPAEEKKEETK